MSKLQEAFEKAKAVKNNAHVPYSNFPVGAALVLKNSDKIYVGCNVENASYGGAVCGERNAIFQAVIEEGTIEPDFMVLVTNVSTGAMPCGFCRQVMSEFCKGDFKIHIANEEKILKTYTFDEILPHRFDKDDLEL